jgi:phosphoribosylanthranilate isomerase
MKWKVCGLRDNIEEVVALEPDYAGFIFYSKSLRFVGMDFKMPPIPHNVKKVGVFVNEKVDVVLMNCKKYKLDFVQLHGSESQEDCKFYKKHGLGVIKAFAIGHSMDFMKTMQYQGDVDYFLFDTKTETYGGSGKKFDWKLLDKYSLEKQYFLSGGIDLESISEIVKIKSPFLHAIDVNSKFEVKPGMKDVKMLKKIDGRLIEIEKD